MAGGCGWRGSWLVRDVGWRCGWRGVWLVEGDGVAVAGGAWERWGKRRCGWRRVAGGGWLESPYISPTEPQFPCRFHLLLHCGQPKPQTLNPRVVHMFFSILP